MKLSKKQALELGLDLPSLAPKCLQSPPEKLRPSSTVGRHLAFESLCKAHGLPLPIPEYPFAQAIGRNWRFDYIWDGWLALEVEGGVHTQGRHTRGQGFLDDIEKYNEAAIMGFVLLRCTPEDIKTGAAFALVKRALASELEQP